MNTEQALSGIRVTLNELINARYVAQRLRVAPRSNAAAARSGAHTSRFRGRGMDFEEVRAYQPGDDIRAMDWRVTARTGQPHTKVFREERERPVMFAVDLGASMHFGTRVAFKSVTAAKAAAFWAWCAARHGDRIGGVLFGDGGCLDLKPRAGHAGVLRFLRALIENPPAQHEPRANGLHQALLRLKSVVRPGSLIVLISDFIGMDAAAEQLLSDLQHHSELAAIQVYDAMETQLPPPGRYSVSNGRNTLTFDSGDRSFRAAYRQRFETHDQKIHGVFRALAIHGIRIATHDDPYVVLSRELRSMYAR